MRRQYVERKAETQPTVLFVASAVALLLVMQVSEGVRHETLSDFFEGDAGVSTAVRIGGDPRACAVQELFGS